jgi:hypothetical protein
MAVLATCVRNEGAYLLEWTAFYRLLGFKKIIIYSNNNTDWSDTLLARLHDYGHITWRPRVLSEKESPQLTAFADLSTELLENPGSPLLQGLEEQEQYLAWLDCDEFLYLKGDKINTIADLLGSYNYPDGLSINWRHFGSSDQEYYTHYPTIERFTQASSPDFVHDKQIKTISRIDKNLYRQITHHRPFKTSNSDAKIIYASENFTEPRAVPSTIIDQGALAICLEEAEIHHKVCQLNHYSIRSKQEYQQKKARGNGYQPTNSDRPHFHDDYFSKRDTNEVSDHGLSEKMSSTLKAAIEAFEKPILEAHKTVISNLLSN